MKKIIALVITVIFSLTSLTATAVSYRGFVEGGAGVTLKNKNLDAAVIDIPIYTTHGVQVLKNLYVGAGIGLNINPYIDYIIISSGEHYLDDIGTTLKARFYGDIRWDGFGLFGHGKRVSPFVDLKIGYQRKFNSDGPRNGMFLTPSLGVRIGCSSKVGINIGLYCDVVNYINEKGFSFNYGTDIMDFKLKLNPFGIIIGMDF